MVLNSSHQQIKSNMKGIGGKGLSYIGVTDDMEFHNLTRVPVWNMTSCRLGCQSEEVSVEHLLK